MRRLVPETLGKSIFRRYKRTGMPRLVEGHGLQAGYASTARPLVWRTVQRLPETDSLGFLRRRLRSTSPEEVPSEVDQGIPGQPESFGQGQTAPEASPIKPAQLNHVFKAQRKTGPPVKRTAVELTKSQPAQKETGSDIPEASALREVVDETAEETQPVLDAGETQMLGSELRAGKIQVPASKKGPLPEIKPARLSSPERPAAGPLASQPEPPEMVEAAPDEKSYIPKVTRPDAPTLISRRHEEKPVETQIGRRAANEADPKNDSLMPEVPLKTSGETRVTVQPDDDRPALENAINQDARVMPPVNEEASPTQVVQRKTAGRLPSRQQAKPNQTEKSPEVSLDQPEPALPPVQPEIATEPDRPQEGTQSIQSMANPVSLESPRPLTNTLRREPHTPQTKPVTPEAGRQIEVEPGALPGLPDKAQPERQFSRTIQRSPEQPAGPDKTSRPVASPQYDGADQELETGAKPVRINARSQDDSQEVQPPAGYRSTNVETSALPTIVHTSASTTPSRTLRQPELPPVQAKREPAPAAIQRRTAPAESPTSPTAEQVETKKDGQVTNSTAAVATEVEPEDSAKALDEMAQQVYQIIQRRLRVEFERSHGLKI